MLPDSSIFCPESWLFLTDLPAWPSGEQAGAALPNSSPQLQQALPSLPSLPSLIQLLCQFSICASLSLRPAPHNCGNVCWCSERKPFSSIPLYTSQSSSTGIRGLMLPCGHKFPYHPVLKHGRSWQRRGLGFNPGNSLGSLGRLWHWPGQARHV